jgi:phosphotransferase system  glucose/maltose/N-acetylglucosamine-specific IIC component
LTNAGSARVEGPALPLLCTGMTTVFRPDRRRIFSGTRTVMLVAFVTLRPSALRAKLR